MQVCASSEFDCGTSGECGDGGWGEGESIKHVICAITVGGHLFVTLYIQGLHGVPSSRPSTVPSHTVMLNHKVETWSVTEGGSPS